MALGDYKLTAITADIQRILACVIDLSQPYYQRWADRMQALTQRRSDRV